MLYEIITEPEHHHEEPAGASKTDISDSEIHVIQAWVHRSMHRSIVMTYKMHICDMFDEIPVMASRGPLKYLFNYFLQYHCFDVNFHS